MLTIKTYQRSNKAIGSLNHVLIYALTTLNVVVFSTMIKNGMEVDVIIFSQVLMLTEEQLEVVLVLNTITKTKRNATQKFNQVQSGINGSLIVVIDGVMILDKGVGMLVLQVQSL